MHSKVCGGANNCTTSRNWMLADFAVLVVVVVVELYSAYASDKKLISYRFKTGFCGGMYVQHYSTDTMFAIQYKTDKTKK